MKVTTAEQVAVRSTEDWRSLVRTAVRMTGTGDLRRAELLLGAAKRLRPSQPEVLLALGRLKARQGAPEEAELLLREAWQLGGNHTAAATLARFLAREIGRSAEALAIVEAALARNPRSALLECVRGEVLLDGGNPVAARHAYERALVLERSSRAARLGLARALVAEAISWIDNNEPTRGLFLLRRAIGIDNAWALPHRAMAMAFDAIGCDRLAAKERQCASRAD